MLVLKTGRHPPLGMPMHRLPLECLERFTPLNMWLLGSATFLTVSSELPGPILRLTLGALALLMHRAVTRLPVSSRVSILLEVMKWFLLRETVMARTLLIEAPDSYGERLEVMCAWISWSRRWLTAPKASAG